MEDAGRKDLAKILELQKICYRENAARYNDRTIQPLTQSIEDLGKEFGEQVFLKIEMEDRIIGSVRAFGENDVCHIGKLIVHPDYQNRGVGTELMIEIERRFCRAGKYELFTGHRDDKNIHLYKKLGYTVFDEKVINDNLTMIYMEKYNARRP
jgi:ribosomal protein S18 acetylase RimI-like enzyme